MSLEDIKQELDKEYETWKPENIGDQVLGKYVDVIENQGENQDTNIYVLEREDGTRVRVWGSAVISKEMKDIPIGANVGIKYLGKRKGAKFEYNLFKVVTDSKKTVEDTI